MDLTIREAAALLGKSERMVRHLAVTGKLHARRVGGHWVIPRDALPGSAEAQRDQMEHVRDRLNRALDRATPPPTTPPVAMPVPAATPAPTPPAPPAHPRRSFYSARDLDAHRVAASVLVEMKGLAGEHAQQELAAARDAIQGYLRLVTDGCHQFHPQSKVERFVRARSQLAGAVSDLVCFNLLHAEPDVSPLADRLERDALGALRGLLRRAERPRP